MASVRSGPRECAILAGMKSVVSKVLAGMAALLYIGAMAPTLQAAPKKPGFPLPTNCILSVTITRGDCPWLGMTDSYAQEQSNKYARAVSIDTATHAPLPSLTQFDGPDGLLGRSEKHKQVVVNSRYFSDLYRGDATRLGMGQEHALGRFLDLDFTRLKPRELVLFLVQAQVIETYWHLEAQLCLVRETDTPDAYTGWFRGIHTYFTNDKNDDAFAFVAGSTRRAGR